MELGDFTVGGKKGGAVPEFGLVCFCGIFASPCFFFRGTLGSFGHGANVR